MGTPSSRAERGYNLVVLAIAVTVLSVMTAAALPNWTNAIRRDQEEELIFRGWQYAEAIRVFQQRTSRYPNTLKELMDIKPRSIRQLWKDPLSEKGDWGLILAGVGPGQINNPNASPDGRGVVQNPDGSPRGLGPGSRVGEEDAGESELVDGSGGTSAFGQAQVGLAGPITGVRSKSTEEALKTLFGKNKYSDWEFTVNALVTGNAQAGAPGQLNQPPRPARGQLPPGFVSGGAPGGGGNLTPRPQLPRVRWIGRPFPEGLEPEGLNNIQNGGLPGGPSALGPAGGNRGPNLPPPRSRQNPNSGKNDG